jgi:hypothetical protein
MIVATTGPDTEDGDLFFEECACSGRSRELYRGEEVSGELCASATATSVAARGSRLLLTARSARSKVERDVITFA